MNHDPAKDTFNSSKVQLEHCIEMNHDPAKDTFNSSKVQLERPSASACHCPAPLSIPVRYN